jgi:hypothetical protein
MSTSPIQFGKIWIDQCQATQGIRGHFGLHNASDYLIGEKLFSFVHASEPHPEFAAELPLFIAEIRRLFTADEIHRYLNQLEQAKYLAPQEPDLDFDELDEFVDEEPRLDNPLTGAEELLRFSRIRQLLS